MPHGRMNGVSIRLILLQSLRTRIIKWAGLIHPLYATDPTVCCMEVKATWTWRSVTRIWRWNVLLERRELKERTWVISNCQVVDSAITLFLLSLLILLSVRYVMCGYKCQTLISIKGMQKYSSSPIFLCYSSFTNSLYHLNKMIH